MSKSKSKLNTALNYREGRVKTERYQRSYFVIIVTRVNNLGDVQGRVLMGSTAFGWLGWLGFFVLYWQKKTIFGWCAFG